MPPHRDGQLSAGSPLVTRTCRVPDVSFRSFLAGREAPRLYWTSPDGLEIAATGAVARITADGEDRFDAVREAATDLFDSVDTDDGPDATRPRLFGGFSFDAEHDPNPPWDGFPSAEFVLPHVQLTRTETETWLSVSARESVASVEETLSEIQAETEALPKMRPRGESPGIESTTPVTSREEWCSQIRHATERIRDGKLKKVVIATALEVELGESVVVPDILERLRTSYPECYRFLVQPTSSGGFFGAPPERLVSLRGQTVETEALAGSIARGETPEEDDEFATSLADSEKVREEHELVAETIRNGLEPLASSVSVGERRLKRLSTIQHLQTPISAELGENEHVLSVVEALHPTPAVGGLPPEDAMRTIRETEGFDRGWYASPVGWFDADGDGEFAVGIRSGVASDGPRHPVRRERYRRRQRPRSRVGGSAVEIPADFGRTRMTYPNRNTQWAETFVNELAAGGVDAVCLAPGSRSTPLTVAFALHDDIEVFSHLDERSAAFFALGRAKRTGSRHPSSAPRERRRRTSTRPSSRRTKRRVPMLVCTADRPPELRDSGANQTVDQEKLYGGAVRWYADVAEPEATGRKLRYLRTTAARALGSATGTPPGPVHLNFPFRKPLEPTEVEGDVPDSFAMDNPLASEGRDGPFVRRSQGVPELDSGALSRIAEAVSDAERGLLVVGPADAPTPDRSALEALADATGFPVLADPLSGHRFGHDRPIVGGYDSYLVPAVTDEWPDPDVVIRFGASPTSKTLRNYLERVDTRQFVVDSAGGWREASFTATDLVVADPTRLAQRLADELKRGQNEGTGNTTAWTARFERAESIHWSRLAETGEDFEGGVLADVARLVPDPATLFVSNSMPVRDLDRFARPRSADVTVLGNRGASGIDGIISSALGAGSATDDPLVLVTGDIAYYHDMNGLLALDRCGVDATIVEINNDGGGIFHMLPIESFDPPFTGQFRTPHGLDYAATGDLYDLDFQRVETRSAFRDAFSDSIERRPAHRSSNCSRTPNRAIGFGNRFRTVSSPSFHPAAPIHPPNFQQR